jgi:hypothetical protein
MMIKIKEVYESVCKLRKHPIRRFYLFFLGFWLFFFFFFFYFFFFSVFFFFFFFFLRIERDNFLVIIYLFRGERQELSLYVYHKVEQNKQK